LRRRIVNVIGGGIVLGAVVNLASTYASNTSPTTSKIGFWLAVAIVGGAALTIGGQALLSVLYFGRGRYAVLIFALDDRWRVLLVEHPFHQRLIPPGGRLKLLELPHEAVGRFLSEEAGVPRTRFSFSPAFHEPESPYTDTVTIIPQPHRVQREDRRQRSLVKFHYAFVFVVDVDDADVGANEQYRPRWYRWDEVDAMRPPHRPFDDIVRRYRDILDILEAEQESAP
jgi:8-oxo-dGTP pyrophosphatase MutT (NUDIX family)